MIVERSLHPQFLSNTYLVAEERGGAALFVDAGGPAEPLLAAADRLAVDPTHVLLTHHHYDHVCELDGLLERWPDLEVLIHPAERAEVPGATGTLDPSQELTVGALRVRSIATPGHTAGMLSFLITPVAGDGREAGEVFTGDTLFRNSVGGVRAPGHTTYSDLRRSIMEELMTLPPGTIVRPGHTDPTSVGEEWERNAFVRVWRGLDVEGSEPCTALGQPATLVLWGDDYDGGHKAWVRWADGGDDIVPGSQVQREHSASE